MCRFVPLTVVLVSLFACGSTRAHSVLISISAPEHSSLVHVEVFYSDGTLANQAEVKVRDDKDQEIAAGRTDSEGKWTFPRPATGLYRVFVNAGAGHRAKDSIYIEDDKALTTPSRDDVLRAQWWWMLAGVACIGAGTGAYLLWRRYAGRIGFIQKEKIQ